MMTLLPDMMIPGLDLIVYTVRHPVVVLCVLAGIAAITVLTIVLVKRSKKKKQN